MKSTILIVEDDGKNMKLFRDLLQANGYSTLEASNGKEGIELARSHLPDLILMDVMMPVMNGIEAIATLKSDERTKRIPVMALTSFALPDEKQRIAEAGCDDYTMKPVKIKAFLAKIRTYCPGSE